MRKKYLSALLFGALLFASAGTFTSCKDYDDDIDNLQSQITDVKNAVTELQKKIADLKYVSNVTSEGNGLKITWNDGTSTTINNVINEKMPEIPTPGDVITFDDETGEILINGKGSGYYALVEGEIEEVKLPYVNEDGFLVLIDEEGNELVTKLSVAPVSAIKNTDGSYTITILCNGEKQEVVVPSAASAIKSVELYGVPTDRAYVIGTTSYVFKLADDSGLRKVWTGCKTLPVYDAHIVRATTLPDGFGMRINPVDVDASEIALKLTNSANADLSYLTLKATANDSVQAGIPRAAAKGGIYDLTVNDIILGKKDSDLTDWTGQLKKSNQNVNFAVNTGSVRSNYAVQVTSTEESDNNLLLKIEVKGDATSRNAGALYTDPAPTARSVTFDKGTAYTIQAATDNAAFKTNLYDLMITADAEAIANYGLEIDQEKHTIKVGKDIDVSTSGEFQFTVYGVTVQGKACTFIYKVKVSDKIVTTGEYTEISHAINAADNFFGIDLSTMKNAMSAEELNTWKTRVDLSKTDYKIYAKYENGELDNEQQNTFGDTGKLFKPTISETNVKNPTAVTEKSKANYVVLNVDNDKATDMKLFTTYYIKVTFNNANGEELNHIIVPVKFTAPTVAEQFEVKSGLEKDGVVYGFYTEADTYRAFYRVPTAFSKTAEGVTYKVTDDVVEGTDKKSSEKFEMGQSITDAVMYKDAVPAGANKAQDVYGKAFTMMAKAETYKNWKYAEDAQKQYKFKMVLLSPIYSGSFAANGTIKVKGGEAFEITNAQLSVKDYNGTAVNILQDVVKNNVGAFSDVRIVETKATGVAGQITSAIVENAVVGTDHKLEKAGVIAGRAASVATDAESKITITVKDAFGYTKSFELPVTVTAQ